MGGISSSWSWKDTRGLGEGEVLTGLLLVVFRVSWPNGLTLPVSCSWSLSSKSISSRVVIDSRLLLGGETGCVWSAMLLVLPC